MANPGGMVISLDGGDPRMGSSAGSGLGESSERARSSVHKLHDSSVSFEEYMHYAAITRAGEGTVVQDHTNNIYTVSAQSLKTPFRKKTQAMATEAEANEKGMTSSSPDRIQHFTIAEEDYVQASRAVRTATWGAVFFLVTTDIIGPFTTPWAFRQMGYGPSTVLYTIFAAFAGYGGYLLWRMFLQLDSDRYPVKTYGDIAFRVYGQTARHGVYLLQSFQLVFNVGILIVLNGQSLSQMAAKGPNLDQNGACFIVLCFAWAISGALLGQIRTLAKLGHLANFAIWLNIIVIISTMAVTAHTLPNYTAAHTAYMVNPGPVVTTAGPPVGVEEQIVGLMQAVYAYGGATLFVEFMSEMRRPFDFWKAMICAQTFIWLLYMVFGLFIYSYQGQFTVIIAYQGISSYSWQTVGNAFGLISSLIAAVMYGNIGIKVIYNNVLVDLFKFPSLGAKGGKLAWCGLVPIYWAIAFVIASAVPQVANLGGFVAAAGILQFTYTFPPMMYLGFQIKKGAIQSNEGFDPATGRTVRVDGGVKRWIRGYKQNMLLNSFLLFFFLGSASTAILGIYSSIVGMIASYSKGATSTFSCNSPVL